MNSSTDFYNVSRILISYIANFLAFILPHVSNIYVQYPTLSTIFLFYISIVIIYKLFVKQLLNLFKWTLRLFTVLTFVYAYNRGFGNFVNYDIPYFSNALLNNRGHVYNVFNSGLRLAWKTIPPSERVVIDKSIETISIAIVSVLESFKYAIKTIGLAIKEYNEAP